MLVLTRREGESITVSLPDGSEVKIIVTQIKGAQVRIGFLAPKTINIERYDEERKLERELLNIKKKIKSKCTDKEFLSFWMDTSIPQLGASAREIVRAEPTRLDEVLGLFKKEFGNALTRLHGR